MNFISEGPVSIRRMFFAEQDFSLLLKWLSDEQVLSYMEGPSTRYTRDTVMAKYGPRAREESHVTPCIIEFSGDPIGYVQYYPLQQEETEAYGAEKDGLPYGIDIFI